MIKLEHVVLASPEQMEFIIEGMRNPMNSWEKSDSGYGICPCDGTDICDFGCEDCEHFEESGDFRVGNNDHDLMQRLSKAGTDHRKYMRFMPVYVRITAPLYWWKEFDTYKVGTVANSCSTMHKIAEKEFTLEDFSCEHMILDENVMDYDLILGVNGIYETCTIEIHDECDKEEITYEWISGDLLKTTITMLNKLRESYLKVGDKDAKKLIWWQMIQLLPSSYNQTRNVMMNYEVLANMYHSRKYHKLDEWVEFCKWIETLPYSELITDAE